MSIHEYQRRVNGARETAADIRNVRLMSLPPASVASHRSVSGGGVVSIMRASVLTAVSPLPPLTSLVEELEALNKKYKDQGLVVLGCEWREETPGRRSNG